MSKSVVKRFGAAGAAIAWIPAAALLWAGVASAQNAPATQPPAQERPDARYSNPSGQDSAPSSTKVNPTKPAPDSKKPQDSKRGEASSQTYVDGKKHDASGGCSTPTDAGSANKGNGASAPGADPSKPVCTTSGDTGHSAKEPAMGTKKDKATGQVQPPANPPPK